MQGFADWLVRHRGLVLVAVSAVTALSLAGIVDPFSGEARLRVDASLNEMLPRDDAGRRFYASLVERFGSDDSLVVALEDPNLFSASGFGRIRRVTRRLERIEGVHHVDSLATALRLRAIDGELEISGFIDETDAGPVDYAQARDELLSNRLLAGSLISHDGRTTVTVVTFQSMPEEEFLRRALDLRVLQAVRDEGPGLRVFLAGTPHIKAEITRILMSELTFMVPAILALMTGLSLVFFRSVVGSLVPVTSVVLAMLWTLGAMGWTGHALNIVTTLIPPLVLIVGFAYSVHVVSAQHQEQSQTTRRGDARAIAARSLGRVGFAVFFTGLTTAAGFLSLTASSLEVIRGFGLYSVVAIAASLLSSMTFVPAVLTFARPAARVARSPLEEALDRSLAKLAARSLAHRRSVLAGGAVVLAMSLLASMRLEVNMEVIGNFDEGTSVRTGYEAINERFSGANLFYVMIEAEEPGAFREPLNLALLEGVQHWLDAQPEIGGSTSMVDHLRIIHQAFHDGRPEALRLPDSRKLTAQLLVFGANEELDDLVDRAHRTATILVRSKATSSADFDRLGRRIDARLAELPPHLRGSATGNAMLLTRATDMISRGQALSLIGACSMIGAILCVYFRSLRTGLIALIPNVLPVAFYFGVMGATGVTLNNATALMGSIVLGIAVDDTIHFLVHFRRAARHVEDQARAAAQALAEVGRPVTYTTIVICLGLLVVSTSALETQSHFGALGALTLAFAWLVDVVFTPALCSVLRTNALPADGLP